MPLIVHTMGMTGFDSVILVVALSLFGIAVVPVTHMLHLISANSDILAKAREIAGKVRLPQLVPAVA